MLSLVSSAARQSVLIVEPDDTEREANRKLFEAAGFRVQLAAGFQEAKRLINADPPELLVTEVRLGPYNGLHLVLRSRMEHPHMGVVVTSRFADPALQAEAARQHAAFLVKPFGGSELLIAASRSLSEQQPGRRRSDVFAAFPRVDTDD